MTPDDLTSRAQGEAERPLWVHVVIEGDSETFRRGSFGYVMAESLIRTTAQRDALAARLDRLRAGIEGLARECEIGPEGFRRVLTPVDLLALLAEDEGGAGK